MHGSLIHLCRRCSQVTLDDNLQLYSVNELTWGLTGDVGATAEGYRFLGPSRYDLCAGTATAPATAQPRKASTLANHCTLSFPPSWLLVAT